MTINARTFEVLYIIRQRALRDLPTTMDDISTFIADRRKDAPDIYGKAYIAPSALVPLLDRLTTGEGLLTLDSHEYEFTPKGSQMADLLVYIDACSANFIENYKEMIALAVLQQRQRIGQGPVSPREASAISNISLDSARRGLAALVEKGLCIEDRSERTPTYSVQAPVAAPTLADKSATATDIEATAHVPLDEDDPIAATLANIGEEDESWITAGGAPPPEDEVDLLPVALSGILGDDGPDEDEPRDDDGPREGEPELVVTLIGLRTNDPEVDDPTADPYAWENVSPEERAEFITQAKACGLDLEEFVSALNQRHQRKLRCAIFGTATPLG